MKIQTKISKVFLFLFVVGAGLIVNISNWTLKKATKAGTVSLKETLRDVANCHNTFGM